ncbi:hypothetical protein TNCV_2073611 [Trichonephila clavipes]|nr:hypothetical protein TNCV_2073611 [Trichonephila clavipes]
MYREIQILFEIRKEIWLNRANSPSSYTTINIRIGPVEGPLTRSSDGNNNTLVVMDYFTKWPEAYPITDPRGLDCWRGSS